MRNNMGASIGDAVRNEKIISERQRKSKNKKLFCRHSPHMYLSWSILSSFRSFHYQLAHGPKSFHHRKYFVALPFAPFSLNRSLTLYVAEYGMC